MNSIVKNTLLVIDQREGCGCPHMGQKRQSQASTAKQNLILFVSVEKGNYQQGRKSLKLLKSRLQSKDYKLVFQQHSAHHARCRSSQLLINQGSPMSCAIPRYIWFFSVDSFHTCTMIFVPFLLIPLLKDVFNSMWRDLLHVPYKF